MTNSLLSTGRLVFIGAGNMAEAMVRGALVAGVVSAESVTVTDIVEERLTHFSDTYGVRTGTDNEVAVLDAEIIVLAVKPQVLAHIVKGFAASVPSDALVVSIAAGIPSHRIEEHLGESQRVVRVMPNTPCLVQQGASAVAAGRHAGPDDVRRTMALLESVGFVAEVDESDLDAVTALSGSGPAYVFLFIEALVAGGTGLGLTESMARDLAVRTVRGAADLLESTGEEPETLRARVTSKGGTTEQAIAVLEERSVREAVIAAMEAAAQRSHQLAEM
jgi:pyrroline-5-carboxylate reductase